MSDTKSSHGSENPCEGECERAEDSRDDSFDNGTTPVSNDPNSLDTRVRERVIKEVGLTSTTFIGPEFPPPAITVKPDIEDTLSEFYKELEKIDTPDGANENTGKPDEGFVQPLLPPKTSTSNETQDLSDGKIVKPAGPEGYQKSSGQKQQSWPHWYQNEPYYPRRQRPGMDQSSGRAAPAQNQQSQWHHPQTLNGPPNPGFHRPPFHIPPPPLPPPPPHVFPNPLNQQSQVNHNWSGSSIPDQYQEESRSFNFPPSNVCSQPPQDFYDDSQYRFDRDDRGRSYDAHSDKINVGLSRDRKEEWCQSDGDYDRHQRYNSENEHWSRDRKEEWCQSDVDYDRHQRYDSENEHWSRDRKEEWCQSDVDYDRHQRYDSENEPWEHHYQTSDSNNAHPSSLVLILMRGLPGSGKSTLARELLSTGPSGLILSTDDYFARRDGYRYEAGLLGAAHEWNQTRAKDAMHDGRSPIIIDNTNLQAWEMKPYVKMALARGYKVDFCEPDTSWKFDPYELEKRNKHGVPQEKIAQMMDRYSSPISIDIVLSSREPLHVNHRRRPEQPHMRRKNHDY